MNPITDTKKSIPDRVFEQLLDAIAKGLFLTGDRIPSEYELAQRFSVSRPSIKTALDRLQLLGIIEQKVGDGTYVKDVTFSDFIATYARYFVKHHDAENLLALRRAIEIESYRTLVKFCNSESLHQLAEIKNHIVHTYTKQMLDTATMYIIRFHHTLCIASGNPYFAQLFQTIQPILYESIFLMLKYTDLDITSHYHAIYAGIVQQNCQTGLPALIRLLETAD